MSSRLYLSYRGSHFPDSLLFLVLPFPHSPPRLVRALDHDRIRLHDLPLANDRTTCCLQWGFRRGTVGLLHLVILTHGMQKIVQLQNVCPNSLVHQPLLVENASSHLRHPVRPTVCLLATLVAWALAGGGAAEATGLELPKLNPAQKLGRFAGVPAGGNWPALLLPPGTGAFGAAETGGWVMPWVSPAEKPDDCGATCAGAGWCARVFTAAASRGISMLNADENGLLATMFAYGRPD
jgi:hypothetical protein